MLSGMIHQPNSLDSVDGEPPLPFDPVPVRLDTGEDKENLPIGKLKLNLLPLSEPDSSLMMKLEENLTYYKT